MRKVIAILSIIIFSFNTSANATLISLNKLNTDIISVENEEYKTPKAEVDSKVLDGATLIESISINKKQLFNNEEQHCIVKLKNVNDELTINKVLITYQINNNIIEVDLYDYYYENIFDGFFPLYDCRGIEDWKPISLTIEYTNETSNTIYDSSLPQEANKYYYDLSPLQFSVMNYSTITEMAESIQLNVDADNLQEIDYGYETIRKVFTNANVSYTVISNNFNLINSARIYIKNQENSKYNYNINLTKSSNMLKGSYNIKNNMANGHYDVDKLEITLINGYKIIVDKDWNTDFFNRLDTADIYISNYDVDINTLRVNPSSVTPDSWAEIKINALDYPEKSNDTVSIGYMFDYGYYQMEESIDLKLNGNVYEGFVYIDKYVKLGVYSTNSICAWRGSDKYTYEIVSDVIEKNGQITVTNELSDTIQPQLQSIKINSSSIRQGEELIVEAMASDNKSGVDRIEVDYESFIVVLKAEGNRFVGKKFFSYYTEIGDYTAKSIKVYDKAGNVSSNYNDKLAALKFNLKSSNIDCEDVMLDTIKISKNKVTQGDRIEFAVEFTGMPVREEVTVTIQHSEFRTEFDIILKQIGDKFIGSILVNEDIANGKWYIKKLDFHPFDPWVVATFYDTRYMNYVIPMNGGYWDFSDCYFDVYNNNVNQYYIDSDSDYINTVIEDKVINGDVYINSFNEDTITFKGYVTINGNLYIVGNLFNESNLKVTGSIYANNIVKREPGTNEKGLIVDCGGEIKQGKLVLGENILPYKIRFYDVKNNIVLKNDKEEYVCVEGKITPGYSVSLSRGWAEIDSYGNFSIKAYVDEGSNNVENIDVYITDRRNNSDTVKFKVVHEKFDINKDNDFDILDLSMLATKYNKQIKDSGYSIEFDYNRDGIIDILDLVKLSKNF